MHKCVVLQNDSPCIDLNGLWHGTVMRCHCNVSVSNVSPETDPDKPGRPGPKSAAPPSWPARNLRQHLVVEKGGLCPTNTRKHWPTCQSGCKTGLQMPKAKPQFGESGDCCSVEKTSHHHWWRQVRWPQTIWWGHLTSSLCSWRAQGPPRSCWRSPLPTPSLDLGDLRTLGMTYQHLCPFHPSCPPGSDQIKGNAAFHKKWKHHQLNRHEFEWIPGDGDGPGSLECCSPWGRQESDTT